MSQYRPHMVQSDQPCPDHDSTDKLLPTPTAWSNIHSCCEKPGEPRERQVQKLQQAYAVPHPQNTTTTPTPTTTTMSHLEGFLRLATHVARDDGRVEGAHLWLKILQRRPETQNQAASKRQSHTCNRCIKLKSGRLTVLVKA